MQTAGTDATNLNWLLQNFVEKIPGVIDAAVVSSDGLLMVVSPGIGRAGGDQLAAVASGLTSMTQGAARCFGGGNVNQIMVELDEGYMLFMSVSDRSSIAVLAAKSCDTGLVAYEMTLLARRVGTVLTPALVAELQSLLPGT